MRGGLEEAGVKLKLCDSVTLQEIVYAWYGRHE